jgi:hypothetical protein
VGPDTIRGSGICRISKRRVSPVVSRQLSLAQSYP